MLTCLTEIMLVAKLVNSIYWWQNWSLKNLLGANPSFSLFFNRFEPGYLPPYFKRVPLKHLPLDQCLLGYLCVLKKSTK